MSNKFDWAKNKTNQKLSKGVDCYSTWGGNKQLFKHADNNSEPAMSIKDIIGHLKTRFLGVDNEIAKLKERIEQLEGKK
jgi:hypothetical protein